MKFRFICLNEPCGWQIDYDYYPYLSRCPACEGEAFMVEATAIGDVEERDD